MNKKKLFVFVSVAWVIAFFAIACDMGTVNWPTETPDAPFLMTARMDTVNNTGIVLKWCSPEGGDEVRGYEVYRWDKAPTREGKADSIYKSGYADVVYKRVYDTTIVDLFADGIKYGGVYYYSVRAFNGAGLGVGDTANYMLEFRVPPSAPINLKAKAINSYSIELNWNHSEFALGGAVIYEIYRSETNDVKTAKKIGETQGTPEYKDSLDTDYVNAKGEQIGELKPNNNYYYWVLATNEGINKNNEKIGGKSPFSNMANDKTRIAPPSYLKVEIRDGDVVRILWTEVEGAQGYQLFFESGIQDATFDFPVAADADTVVDANGKLIPSKSKFKLYAAGIGGKPDTLEYKDNSFYNIQVGAEVFYTVRGVEDYAKNLFGDKWWKGRKVCEGNWSDKKENSVTP